MAGKGAVVLLKPTAETKSRRRKATDFIELDRASALDDFGGILVLFKIRKRA